MSTLGNAAIASYIGELERFIDARKSEGKDVDETLRLLREKLETDKKAADSGWL